MARIFAVANQKGGVGKTTTAINLAASLAACRQRVLLVDIDPQGNATMGCGVDKHELEHTTLELLLEEVGVMEGRVAVAEAEGLWLLPANSDLTAAEVELLKAPRRERRLRDALAQAAGEFDYVIIDCPPSLNMLTLNAMVAADGVIIPMQCEYYALEGISALVNTIDKVQRAVNPGLRIEGILRTMYDPRINLAEQVSAQLVEHFGQRVYRTVIPRNVRLAEAPSHGLPVLQYDRTSRGAQSYLALAGEILRRAERPRG